MDNEEAQQLEVVTTEIVATETGFKLYKDFGVRALIASLSIVGFLVAIVVAISSNNMAALDKISILLMPIVITIINYYFLGSIVRDMKQ